MKQFEEIKKEILERAHNARACTIQYKRAYQSENLETLCNVIKDNFWWCCRNNVLDGELIDKYKKIFSDNKIYHNVSIKSGFLLTSGNSTVEAFGDSTVEAYDNSTVKAFGDSTVNAIHSGVVNGLVYEIDGFIEEFKAKYSKFIIILTGGDADFLAMRLKNTIFANSNFLLESLNQTFQYTINND